MTQNTTHTAPVQRNAQRVFLALCMVFGVAVCGAATVKATNPEQPAVRFVNALPAASDKAPVLLASASRAAASLVIDATPATPVSTFRPARTLQMEVTAYCPCTKCCGP